jgi:hypothetical protein
MIDIIKAKLARGGQLSHGELKLLVKDIFDLVLAQQEKINELEEKLNAKSRGGGGRTRKADPSTEVRPEDTQ